MPKNWKPLSIGLAAVAIAATAGVLIWVLGFRGEDENTAKAPTAAHFWLKPAQRRPPCRSSSARIPAVKSRTSS